MSVTQSPYLDAEIYGSNCSMIFEPWAMHLWIVWTAKTHLLSPALITFLNLTSGISPYLVKL